MMAIRKLWYIAGWVEAHADAFVTAFRVFRALRGRRLATQKSGETWKQYYKREGTKAILAGIKSHARTK
jgi:hypothetical protein